MSTLATHPLTQKSVCTPQPHKQHYFLHFELCVLLCIIMCGYITEPFVFIEVFLL